MYIPAFRFLGGGRKKSKDLLHASYFVQLGILGASLGCVLKFFANSSIAKEQKWWSRVYVKGRESKRIRERNLIDRSLGVNDNLFNRSYDSDATLRMT